MQQYIQDINYTYEYDKWRICNIWQSIFDKVADIKKFKQIFNKIAKKNLQIYHYWYNNDLIIDEILIKYYCKNYIHKFNERYFENFINRYIYIYKYINLTNNNIFIYLQKYVENTILQQSNLSKRLIYIYIQLMQITQKKNNKCIDILINHINIINNIEDKQNILNMLFNKGLLNIPQIVKVQYLQNQLDSYILLNTLKYN